MENRIISEKSDGSFQVYLHPNETLAIPFVFQSFSSGLVHSNTEYPKSQEQIHEKGLLNRTISVFFTRNLFLIFQGFLFKCKKVSSCYFRRLYST